MVWLLWASTIIIGIVICTVVCSKIENTGLKRLGATGSLFKYQ
jgi:hypothetical protein